MYRRGHPEVFLESGVLYLFSKYRGVIAKRLYWNRISAWVFYCGFAAYFRGAFYWECLLVAASLVWAVPEGASLSASLQFLVTVHIV